MKSFQKKTTIANPEFLSLGGPVDETQSIAKVLGIGKVGMSKGFISFGSGYVRQDRPSKAVTRLQKSQPFVTPSLVAGRELGQLR